jgi:hypothetical protein
MGKEKRLINIFWFDTLNSGDIYSGAGTYFSFNFPVEFIDIKNPDLFSSSWKEKLKDSFIIIGGGGHIHLPSLDYNNGICEPLNRLMDLSDKIVIWGIGNNILGTKKHIYPNCLRKALLIGLRDDISLISNEDLQGGDIWGLPNTRHVPCPSCMSYFLFVTKQEALFPKYEIGYCVHHNSDIEIKSNRYIIMDKGEDLPCIIKFIRESELIVTDSYHAAYWALLLGRRVKVPYLYSSKFYSLHKSITDNNAK